MKWWPIRRPVPLWARVAVLEKKAGQIMTAQDDINAAVATIQAVITDLTAAVASIQAQLAGQGVDTTALDAQVAALQAVQAQVDALVTPPAPPAA